MSKPEYKIIAASDRSLIGKEVDFDYISRARSTGWGYTFVRDRQVHLLHRDHDDGSAFIEVSAHTMDQTFDILLNGN